MMEDIVIQGASGSSRITFGDMRDRLVDLLPDRKLFVITDRQVHTLYAERFPPGPVFIAEPGEQSKTPDVAMDICRWLLAEGAGRDAFVLGIGGGLVCDLAGFVASIYMRGLDFGFVATTLLAQVDASVGGKNGVNLDGYKNMVGTFRQPRFVLCDTSLLKSLPEAELRNGLAEVVKHTLIADKKMFQLLREQAHSILSLDKSLLDKVVAHSVRVKAHIVNRDEKERGERRKLNLGHTWGHAVEKTQGISHGQAVSIGLAFAAGLSEHKGVLRAEEHRQLLELLTAFGLPIATKADPGKIFSALAKDKKREAGHIHFVLMKGIGEVRVVPIPIGELEGYVFKRL